MKRSLLALSLMLAFPLGEVGAATAQHTAFTYQGVLNANGHPANGNVDLTFTLYDAATGGNQVGTTISALQTAVTAGLFNVDLDFPGVFTGTQLWVEVTVGAETLSPRQPVNSVPVAQYALSGTAGPSGATGAAGATGAPGATGLQGAPGAPGATGSTGDIGPMGATGLQGIAGVTGVTGNTGGIGATGPSGNDGAGGPPGPAGAAGPAGTSANGLTVNQLAIGVWNTTGPTYAVGAKPIGMAFDGNNIWVANSGASTVTKILATTGAIVGTYTVGAGPVAVAFDGTNIWTANSTGQSVSKLLASTGALVATYSLNISPSYKPTSLVFDGTYIWTICSSSNTGQVVQQLASTGAVVPAHSFLNGTPDNIVFDGTHLWVAENTPGGPPGIGSGEVESFLPSSPTVTQVYGLTGLVANGIAFDGTNIWVSNDQLPFQYLGTSYSVATFPINSSVQTYGTYYYIPVGTHPQQILFDGTNIWVANKGDGVARGTVTKFATNGTVLGTFTVGVAPIGLAFDGTHVWVSNSGDNTLTKL